MNYGRKMVTESLDFITLEKESLKLIQTKSGDRPCDITMTQNGNLVYTDPKSRTNCWHPEKYTDPTVTVIRALATYWLLVSSTKLMANRQKLFVTLVHLKNNAFNLMNKAPFFQWVNMITFIASFVLFVVCMYLNFF